MARKMFAAFPVHVQPAILRIFQEAHGTIVAEFSHILQASSS